MNKTTIEWTRADDGTPGATWNAVRGCSRISPGCGGGNGEGGCYAEAMAGRFCGPGQPYEGLVRLGKQGARWTGEVRLIPERLADPLRWRKPRRVFVNSMSDLFHERLSNEEIAAVFGVMAAAPRHTFQILTKRAERLKDWFRWIAECWDPGGRCRELTADRISSPPVHPRDGGPNWPLPNVWLGVSVEDQQRANERIPHLLATPAAVRFVSYEPALGPVNLRSVPARSGPIRVDALTGCWDVPNGPRIPQEPRIHWVIAGGESGPGARPFELAWARDVIRQCKQAGVAVFVKQLGTSPFDGAHESASVEKRLRDRKGGDMNEWPLDLRVREMPR